MPRGMESFRNYFEHGWLKLVIPLGVVILVLAAGFIARKLLFAFVRKWSVRGTNHFDIIITESMGRPMILWALIIGLILGLRTSELPPRFELKIEQSLYILWIVSLTLMFSKLAGNLVKFYGARVGGSELPATSLTKNLTQMFVVIVGTLVLLQHLRINITPMLTALGVGGLAVALALQDTLSNLFGGFYVSIAGQVRLGDYIKLNTGEEGYVNDISWRCTTMRALQNNFIIVPNSKLAQAIVTNFSLPEKRMALPILIGVSSDADPDTVEQAVLDEILKSAPDIPGLLSVPEPTCRLIPGFGDSALQFTLVVHISEFSEQFRIQGEVRKRILKRFREEGIEMPYPTTTVILRQPEP